tara:strand:+ start:16 stop:471 length:456 start_codon:yes stop_codon:yes gene_type:complete
MSKSVKTPCIGICSTVFGDEVCRGCKRFQHEIIQWNGYDDDAKRSILNRLELLKVQIMEPRIRITDEGLLKAQLLENKIKFDEDNNALCWVFDLLRSGSQSITNPVNYGFELIDNSVSNLSVLKKVMEDELFKLSEAHYQRYFKTEKYFNV